MSFVYERIGADVADIVHWETYPEYQNSWKASSGCLGDRS